MKAKNNIIETLKDEIKPKDIKIQQQLIWTEVMKKQTNIQRE